MRRVICLFLLLWFPLFAMAAQVMSTKMQLASLPSSHLNHNQSVAVEAPSKTMETGMVNCHMSEMSDDSSKAPSTSHQSKHDCKLCGFCVMSNGMAQFTNVLPQFVHFDRLPSDSFFLIFHSQRYSPAVKPPILA